MTRAKINPEVGYWWCNDQNKKFYQYFYPIVSTNNYTTGHWETQKIIKGSVNIHKGVFLLCFRCLFVCINSKQTQKLTYWFSQNLS